jgi:hypothetical protein
MLSFGNNVNFVIMLHVENLTKSKVVAYPAVSVWVTADIAARLQSNVGQVVCTFMSAAVPLNVVKTFRNSGIYLLVDDAYLFFKVIPGLIRRHLNPACLQSVPIPEETEEETARA